MAQPTAQPIPTRVSLSEARELVTQRYLSPALAEKLLVKWVDAGDVGWRYEYLENNSGISTETALNKFWRPVGLLINWEESRAARRVEPRTGEGARREMARMSVGPQPLYNFFVY